MRSLRRGAGGLGVFLAGAPEPDFCIAPAEIGSRPAVILPGCMVVILLMWRIEVGFLFLKRRFMEIPKRC